MHPVTEQKDQKPHQRAFKDAVQRGDVAAMRGMLEKGLITSIPPAIGRTALFLAMRASALETLKLLLRAGVDPNSTNKAGESAAYVAAESQHLPELLEALLKAGANPNGQPDMAPVHIAVARGNSKGLEILLAAGADIRLTCYNDSSLLHEAVRCGYDKLALRLLEAGLPINAVDRLGFTPLHYAMSNGKAATPGLLLEHGADIHARSHEGFTPALYAAKLGRLDAFDLLVNAGADPLARDNEGRSAFDWSLKHHWNAVSLATLQRHPSLAPTEQDALDAAFVKAVRDGNTGVASILAGLGADVGQKPGGRTLLQCAPAGNEEMKRLLRSLKTGTAIASAMDDDSAPSAAPHTTSALAL